MRYDVARVQVMPKEERRTQWKFRDKYLAGVEHVYTVLDGNFKGANRWEFLVRVPDAAAEGTEVRLAVVPNVRAWAGLDRKALMCNRASVGRHRGGMDWKVVVAIAMRRGVEKTLVHDVGKRHRRSGGVGCRQGEPDVLEQEREAEGRGLVTSFGDRRTVNLVGGCRKHAVGEHVEQIARGDSI